MSVENEFEEEFEDEWEEEEEDFLTDEEEEEPEEEPEQPGNKTSLTRNSSTTFSSSDFLQSYEGVESPTKRLKIKRSYSKAEIKLMHLTRQKFERSKIIRSKKIISVSQDTMLFTNYPKTQYEILLQNPNIRNVSVQCPPENDKISVNMDTDPITFESKTCQVPEEDVKFLTPKGNVYSVGRGYFGQLGHGNREDKHTPLLISELKDKKVVSIACGNDFSVVVTERKEVFCFGFNGDGQLGLGDGEQREIPDLLLLSKKEDIFQADGGKSHCIFLSRKGTVYTSGNNDYGQLGIENCHEKLEVTKVDCLKDINMVRAGNEHSLFMNSSGSVLACGNNSNGQLGLGDKNNRPVPVKILKNVRDCVNVFCGPYHSIFLNSFGEAYSCGSNSDGMLGIGDKDDRNFATKIKIRERIKNVYCGEFHTICVTEAGEQFCFGNSKYGQFGFKLKLFKTSTAKPINGKISIEKKFMFIKDASCGCNFSIFYFGDNTFHGVGKNQFGQLGIGEKKEKKSHVTEIKGLSHVMQNETQTLLLQQASQRIAKKTLPVKKSPKNLKGNPFSRSLTRDTLPSNLSRSRQQGGNSLVNKPKRSVPKTFSNMQRPKKNFQINQSRRVRDDNEIQKIRKQSPKISHKPEKSVPAFKPKPKETSRILSNYEKPEKKVPKKLPPKNDNNNKNNNSQELESLKHQVKILKMSKGEIEKRMRQQLENMVTLEEDNRRLKREIARKKQTSPSPMHKYENENEIKRLKEEVNQEKTNCRKSEMEKIKWKKEANILKNDLHELKQKLQTQDSEVERKKDFERQKRELDKKLTKSQDESKELERKFIRSEKTKKDLERKITKIEREKRIEKEKCEKEMKEKIERENRERERVSQSSTSKTNDEVARLEKKVEILENNKREQEKSHEKDKTRLTNEVNTVKKQIKSLEVELGQEKRNKTRLTNEVNDFKKQIVSLEEGLNEEKRNKNKTETKTENELEKVKLELKDLQKKFNKTEKQLKETQKRKNEQEKELNDTKKTLQQNKDEMSKKTNESSLSSKYVIEINSLKKELETIQKTETEKVKKVDLQIQKKEEELKDMKRENEKISNEKREIEKKLNDKISKLEEQVKSSKRSSSYSSSDRKYQKEIDKLEEKVKTLKDDLKTEKGNTRKMEQMERLMRKMEFSKKETERRTKDEVDKLKDEIRVLRKKSNGAAGSSTSGTGDSSDEKFEELEKRNQELQIENEKMKKQVDKIEEEKEKIKKLKASLNSLLQ